MIQYAFVCILMVSGLMHAQNNQELFLHGNELYQQGEFEKALEKYDAISNSGYGVLVHSAHAYYKQGEVVRALLYLKKAYKQALGDDAFAIKRRITELEFELGIDSKQSAWFTYIHQLSKRFSLAVWQLLLLMLFWVLFFTFLYAFHRIVLCSVVLIGTIVYAWACYSVYTYNTQERALIFSQTELHSGKDDRLTTGKLIKQGEEIIIKQEQDPWYKVQYNSSIGWVRGDSFKRI